MINPTIHIYSNQDQVITAAKQIFLESYHSSARNASVFNIAFSGGKTPEPFYHSLKEAKLGIAWENIHLFMMDERFVTWDHPDSNWGMIRRVLLNYIEMPEANLHPITIQKTPEITAKAYDNELKHYFGFMNNQEVSLDLLIMGVGADGHTASLFSNIPVLKMINRLAVDVYPEHVPHSRISMTLSIIQRAKQRMFLVTGIDKAERIRDVLIRKDEQYPATLACQGQGEVLFILDEAAASRL